jgi:hypothetical protein
MAHPSRHPRLKDEKSPKLGQAVFTLLAGVFSLRPGIVPEGLPKCYS